MTITGSSSKARYVDPDFGRSHDRAFVGYCDIVESVRLYEMYGSQVGELWESAIEALFKTQDRYEILQVEGDALIYAAKVAADVVDIAIALRDHLSKEQIGGTSGIIQIRGGLVEGPFWRGRHNSYGSAINLAARLADMALPGELLLSEAVRLHLPARFDMCIVDRGDCFLRNVEAAVRVHAIPNDGSEPALPLMIPDTALKLRIAVFPPTPLSDVEVSRPLADAFADAITTELSTVRGFGVISRLSTRRLSPDSTGALGTASDLLGAHYVVSGRCRFSQDRFDGWLELSDTKNEIAVWSGRVGGAFADLFAIDGLAADISRSIVTAVFQGEYERTKTQPLPTIENHTLLVAGINLMHSLSEREFQRAHMMLTTLADRASRTSTPLAWLARWHNLRVLQGWSSNPDEDSRLALDLCRRALNADPGNSLAHTMMGMTHTHLEKRLDLAADNYSAALATNPSEPLAWLLQGALRSFTDAPEDALHDVYQANALSPVDPARYYYLTLIAGAHLTAGEDARALDLTTQALKFNRHHLSSWRIKAAAEWRSGQADAARASVAELLKRDPEFTVARYLAAAPSASFQIGKDIAKCLRAAGVPE